jgi:hypothetical protein
VWIFNGTPGDDEHHTFYEKNIARLRKAFTGRFGIPAGKSHGALRSRNPPGYDGACARETLLTELAKAADSTHQPNAAPVWLIFQGHANAIAGGANFNLPGTGRERARNWRRAQSRRAEKHDRRARHDGVRRRVRASNRRSGPHGHRRDDARRSGE